ncbi:MAG TPA: type 4a pilus biogenesis protein PilO [bacterium]|nr:type 4a pilus biogenesis protein PilO [bacterium]
MTRRERLILMVIFPLGMLLLFYYFIYSPNRAEHARLQAQLQQQKAEVQRMEDTARQITRLRAEFARLQAFVAELETKLPAEKDLPALLVQLERLARSLAINLEAIRPSPLERPKPPAAGAAQPAQPPQPVPTYLTLPINLSIRGTFEQVVRLATAMNDFPRMVAIRDIALNPAQLPELGWNINAVTFVLPRGAR